MMTLDVFIRQENISLYKKLLADRNITDGQRDVIGKRCWLRKKPGCSTFSAHKSKRKPRVRPVISPGLTLGVAPATFRLYRFTKCRRAHAGQLLLCRHPVWSQAGISAWACGDLKLASSPRRRMSISRPSGTTSASALCPDLAAPTLVTAITVKRTSAG